jgi:two-component system, OmpR family, response regulator
MSEPAQIMVIEDDESLGFLIKETLNGCGWDVHLFRDGEMGLSAFHHQVFDLCILDIMLPAKDGFSVAEEMRKYNQHLPIVFLTARNQMGDRIRGFQIGCDDYVCKPFSIEEFKYRVEAILKRCGTISRMNEAQILAAGYSTLDVHNLTLSSQGAAIRLTDKECKVLSILFRHVNRVVEREVFLRSVWEDDGFFVARSMDVFISKLRKHLHHDSSLRIENIRSVGYILKHFSNGHG